MLVVRCLCKCAVLVSIQQTEYNSALRVFLALANCVGMAAPVPFTIDIPEEALKDLRERLLRARLPEPLEGVGWKYGTEFNYLKVRKLESKRAMLHHFVRTRVFGVQDTREIRLIWMTRAFACK